MVHTASLALLSCLVFASRFAGADDVRYDFNIENLDVAPDGYTRNAILVNRVFPGTMIQAHKDDVLHINVVDQISNSNMRKSTSIHWHGLFQHKTSSMDGPSQVNQCPIPPNTAFEYDIPLNGQSGTFWYHSHLATQYVDGQRGPLIVYDPSDPFQKMYDVDDETTVITLDDWYHNLAVPLQASYLSSKNSNGAEPVPDAGLINGKGRYKGGPLVPWSMVNVKAGQRYRFRLINTSAFAQYRFAVQGHKMVVIEADGILHNPVTVDSLNIYVGQRYSFVLTANQKPSNYWISASMTVSGASSNKNLDTDNIHAILRYEGAPQSDPSGSFKPGGIVLSENNLQPFQNPGAPGGDHPADQVIDLKFDKTKDGSGVVAWTINGVQYIPPRLPTLLNILSNNYTTASQFNKSENTFVVQRNQVIELRIHGALNGITHPFHLHGHTFDIIQSSDGGGPNYKNPPRRDVVGVGGSGVIIRFETDNPGAWFLHCHIDWHLEAGLAVVFAEAPEENRNGGDKQEISEAWDKLCDDYYNLPPEDQ